jgi:hypothetical protein
MRPLNIPCENSYLYKINYEKKYTLITLYFFVAVISVFAFSPDSENIVKKNEAYYQVQFC